MSKTSLNLIAILVFAMTLSTLLGPLLSISPYVPAIAIAIVLGFATLDTFSLQGQAGTLLIDWLASTSSDRRARIVRHEAGHFLVAHLSGIPITGYALTAWEAFKQGQRGQGGVAFDDRELASQLERGTITAAMLNRYGTVWMAGIAAEALVYGDAEGGAEDRQKLRTVLAQVGRPAAAFEPQERAFALQARHLLETHRNAYEALVAAMEKRESLESCCQAIAQHQPSAIDN